MSSQPSQPSLPRPGRALAVVLIVVTGLYLALILGPRHSPRLGLDLRGGTSAVLTATAPGGRTPSTAALGQTVDILRNRLFGNGVSAVDVTSQGSNQIVVQVPGGNGHRLVTDLLRSAQLRFRLVRETAAAALTSAGAHPVRTEFPAGVADDAVQRAFDALTCGRGANTGATGLDRAGDLILACSADGKAKFVLAPAAVAGRDISSAATTVDQLGAWTVALDFNGHGTKGWAALTTTAWQSDPPAACSGVLRSGCNEIAVVLDGVVQSDPSVQDGPIATGRTEITGHFTEAEAKTLANVLKYGSLPVHLSAATTSTISASLGAAELRGGLMAGAIGMSLVVAYMVLSYRALAGVAVTSLALSAVLLYALVTLLGEWIGYTLTLAGIAGFIVAVGITADSFVVLFERVRDELREGCTLRSGVRGAWPRARRTILSADTVAVLAALVLYLVSIGDVRGFAFTLGLSTICDLFVVFAFTYPVVTVLARIRSGRRSRPPGRGRRRRPTTASAA
jgi:preprotein translocase subunit SecD